MFSLSAVFIHDYKLIWLLVCLSVLLYLSRVTHQFVLRTLLFSSWNAISGWTISGCRYAENLSVSMELFRESFRAFWNRLIFVYFWFLLSVLASLHFAFFISIQFSALPSGLNNQNCVQDDLWNVQYLCCGYPLTYSRVAYPYFGSTSGWQRTLPPASSELYLKHSHCLPY